MNTSTPRSYGFLLGGVLIGSLVLGMLTLRLHTALKRGVYQFDEAYYLLEAKTFRRAAEQAIPLLTKRLSLSDFKKSRMEEGTLFPPGKGTPLYVFMMIPFALLPIPFAAVGNLVSAISTVFAGLALYLGARALGTPKAESLLLAALFFVSPIVTYYGVSTMPHSMACMLFLLSIGALLKGEFTWAGLGLGLTLTSHYGMLPGVLLCLAWTQFEIFYAKAPDHFLGRQTLRMWISFLSPILIFEGVYRLVRWRFADFWKDITFRTYLEQFVRMFFMNTPTQHFSFAYMKHNALVFRSFERAQGLEMTLLMLISLAVLGVRFGALERRSRGLLLTTTILLLFWLFNPGYMATRIIMFLLPGLFLLLAVLLGQIPTDKPRNLYLLRAALIGLILCSSIRSWQMSPLLRSPYPVAAHDLAEQGYRGPVVDPSNVMVWQFYLGQRVDFEKGYRIGFSTVKNHIYKLLDAPNAPKAIPFCFISQWNWELFGPGMVAFRDKLTRRSPAKTWPLPYAHLDLFHYEDYIYIGLPQDEVLQMYWVTKKDFEGIPY